jgi:molybdate transport system substrate-binding protein
MKVRTRRRTFIQLLLATLACFASTLAPAHATDIHVACASNFTATLEKLAVAFERNPLHRLRISSGSTGKLFAQIQHGAPFDIFLSADRERPALLHKEGLADAPFTYAIGRLALYAPAGAPRAMLEHDEFKHLAIANPQTAPYGAAARTVLERMKQWGALQPRLVIGENIGQTFQFVHSNNAELGFVALAQVRTLDIPQERYWIIPSEQHASLEQDGVLLRGSRAPDAARSFLAYLHSTAARAIIERDGYGLP